MKIRLLIIIGIIIFAVTAISLFLAYNQEIKLIMGMQMDDKPSIDTLEPLFCGDDFIQQGNGCVLDPELIKPNTVIIYEATEHDRTRFAIAPPHMVMNLTGDDSVTFVNNGTTTVNIFVNDGDITVNVYDNSEGIWKVFNDVKPFSQRTLIINDTGYYQFIIQNSLHGATGEIVALSEDTNSLPIDTKALMAQVIIGSDFGKGVGLISIGSGGAEPGITIGIHEKFRDKYDDSEKFYYEKYKEMIPFDVPILIEFREPFTFG